MEGLNCVPRYSTYMHEVGMGRAGSYISGRHLPGATLDEKVLSILPPTGYFDYARQGNNYLSRRLHLPKIRTCITSTCTMLTCRHVPRQVP